jgi:hypothetical protein
MLNTGVLNGDNRFGSHSPYYKNYKDKSYSKNSKGVARKYSDRGQLVNVSFVFIFIV